MAKEDEDKKTVEAPKVDSGPTGEGRPSLGTGIAEKGATTIEKKAKEDFERKRRMDEMLGIKPKKKKGK